MGHVVLQGPIKILKRLNISLMDIPGLSDDDDAIVNSGLEMASKADILFLVMKRKTGRYNIE